MILAVTGHRPERLGGYGRDATLKLNNFALRVLKKHRPEYLMIGMALGWDTACANAALDLGIKFTAAVPFRGQERRWHAVDRAHYNYLLSRAFDVHVVSDGGYSHDKLLKRNRFMVDQAHAILALWSGERSGTSHAVGYAVSTGKPVFNAWEEWQQWPERPRTN